MWLEIYLTSVEEYGSFDVKFDHKKNILLVYR